MLSINWNTATSLYALLYMGNYDRPVTVAEIAKSANLSRTYLAKTLQQLRRRGFIRTEPGRGYYLARPAPTISILEVLKGMEPGMFPKDPCLIKNDQCTVREKCALGSLCTEVSKTVASALETVSLAEIPLGPIGLPDCLNTRKAAN